MRRILLGLGLALACTTLSSAQQPEQPFGLKGDLLFRRETTKDFFDGSEDQGRWRGQARPRLELNYKRLALAVGGEFNYSSDENTLSPAGEPPLLIIRDNYKSRDARLDLASLRLQLASWLRLDAGRMLMPVPLTEMLWDRDLRPQGAAATLSLHDSQGGERFSVTGLVARGSHTFYDDETDMLLVSAAIGKPSRTLRSELRASFLTYRNLVGVEPMLRRQNSRLAPGGLLGDDYQTMDLMGALRSEGPLPSEIVVDYAWNLKKSQNHQGFWLTLALGSIQTSRSRGEYVYARVDPDVTVAAYAGDDFYWETGWEGHRGDFGVRTGQGSSVHTVGQLIRFKDSPDPAERDHWIKRLRLEVRWTF